jgi:hypothetical protein
VRLIFAAALMLFAAAPAAAEVRTLAEVHTPDRGGHTAFPVIDAYGGRVVWSDYDPAIDAWRLMEHARGVTRAVPVAPRATPFDVDLGTGPRGGLVAAYSRCARGLRLDMPTPQGRRTGRHGCDIYAYTFATARERRIVRSRADEYWPSMWRGRVAFVRGYAGRRDPDRTATPYLYLGARRLRRPSSVITVRHSGPEGRTIERRRLSTMIEGLDLRGGAADRIRSVDAPSLGGDGVTWLFTNRGEPEYFGAFVRGRAKASPRPKAVAFAHAGGVAYYVDGGPGAEFEPTAQPGGTFALKADDAVAYSRMPRSWLPIRPPR